MDREIAGTATLNQERYMEKMIMEYKKGDKVGYGPFLGVVRRIGRKPGTIGMIWVWITGYDEHAGGMDGEEPFEHVVWAKDLRPLDVKCPNCKGSGFELWENSETGEQKEMMCIPCHGRGKVPKDKRRHRNTK